MLELNAWNLFETEDGEPTDYSWAEKQLMLAIMKRAVLDYLGSNPEHVADAREWIFGDAVPQSEASAFSFPWICEQLDLEADQIANGIGKMDRWSGYSLYQLDKLPAQAG